MNQLDCNWMDCVVLQKSCYDLKNCEKENQINPK